MIIKDESEAQPQVEASESANLSGGQSSVLPPAFDEAISRATASYDSYRFSEESPEAVGDQPPPFEPYIADYFETDTGNIISHDPHLNEDGEALYRFLLSQAATPPLYRLHCRGTHLETHSRWVTSTNTEGRSESRHETYTETLTDFDFYIDIGNDTAQGPVHWSVADSEPAYRGRMVHEIQSPQGKRKAKRAENKVFKAWMKERTARGLPPWTTQSVGLREGNSSNGNALRSSKTLREWADDYCGSQKYLKEFVYNKVLYGWDLQQLESAIHSSIVRTLYDGDTQVEFETRGSKIYIRPNNRLSRALSNKFLKILSFIFFLYPFIWLFKRFHSRGGGRWEVCGGAYPLKRRVPIEEDTSVRHDGSFDAPSRQKSRETGRLVGMREGDWFRKWEATIIRAVHNRYESSTPISTPVDDASMEVSLLDGY